jgi:hypothetical protein
MTMNWVNVNIYFDEQAMKYHLDIYQEGQWIHHGDFSTMEKAEQEALYLLED